MVLSATGRRISRASPKSPVRYATGKRSGASENHPSANGRIVRSAHLGYDCYATGLVNGVGKIRLILRPGRLPINLPMDVRLMLPTELWWPQRDHEAAHHLVDAVMTFDLSTLATWKSSWPEHEFGFEKFMYLAERRIAAVRESNIPDVPKLPKRLTGDQVSVMGSTSLPKRLAMFPGTPVSVELHARNDRDTYAMRTYVVRFDDGEAALRVDIGGYMADGGKMLCTRAYVDLLDGSFEVVEHYPGRLQALGLPANLIYTVLGVKTPGEVRRRVLSPATPESLSPGHRAARSARRIQAVMSEGDPNAVPHRHDVPEPEPVQVIGNKRYERALAEDDGRFDVFPDAPTAPKT